MSQLSSSQRELVALGAAMGSNCGSCMEYHIPEATKAGLTAPQISEAIELADKVRQVPARKVLDAALRKLRTTTPAQEGADAPACAHSAPARAGESGCCAT